MHCKYTKRMISLICVIAILIGGGYYCNKLMTSKLSFEQYKPFFDSDEEFDVLFLGSSHVYFGISPLDLYHNYGITSYNLAMMGNYIPSNYYHLKEVLKLFKSQKRALPKVVVVDISADGDRVTRLHSGWDAFPLSKNKMEMARSLVPEQDRLEMLIPFALYHSRWNELSKEDFVMNINRFYGMGEGGYGVVYPADEIVSDSSDIVEVDLNTLNYLNQIEEECEMLGIKLIFIHIPYTYRPDLQRMANGICQYEEEQGNLCVNYMNQVIQLDYDIDFFDAGHLNPAGMRIMTDEVGKMLVGLGVEDHRGEAQTEHWNQVYEDYVQFRIVKLREVQNAKSFLMAINDPDLLSSIKIYEGILGNVQISKLIKRLKVEGHQIMVTKERPEIVSEDGQAKLYDVYCEVYRRDDPTTLIYNAGFTL